MESNGTEGCRARAFEWWLLLSVHFDAFRAAPSAYLTALRWRLCGKRLRARGQFAPLLNQSQRAYALWSLQQEKVRKDESAGADVDTPILAIVDVSAGQDGLNNTLRSLSRQGVQTLLIGTANMPTLIEAAAEIDWTQDPWLMPIAVGDRIAPGAIIAYRAAAVAHDTASIIYADDDLFCKTGRYHTPHFKPDWNSELFRHFDYLTGACIVRVSRSALERLADSADWAGALVAYAAEQFPPVHLRKMLHHRHTRPVARRAARPITPSNDLPSVTVIVPTRNRVDLLRTCLEGVAATRYPAIEVIVVDNDSDDPQTLAYLDGLDPLRHRVLRHAGAFNYSAINNRAVEEAHGHLLCLLNNDIEVIDPEWLATMAVQAQRTDVGAVGAQLLYPDGRIQHAGVVIGVGNAAGHAHRFLHPDEEGYFRRHAMPQFISAVTAACLVVVRDRYLTAGGLDARNFPVAFNDVDLCMRLNQRGWQSFYEPRATLIHHESVSRGLDLDPVGKVRFAAELAALQRLWSTDTMVDPFHHPNLSRASERFAISM